MDGPNPYFLYIKRQKGDLPTRSKITSKTILMDLCSDILVSLFNDISNFDQLSVDVFQQLSELFDFWRQFVELCFKAIKCWL